LFEYVTAVAVITLIPVVCFDVVIINTTPKQVLI
jgi:hypothetical protein